MQNCDKESYCVPTKKCSCPVFTLAHNQLSMFAPQIKYKEDLQILKGLGCFLYDTPDMVRSRHLRKLWVRIHLHNTQLPHTTIMQPVANFRRPTPQDSEEQEK